MESASNSTVTALARASAASGGTEAERAWRADALKMILLTLFAVLIAIFGVGIPFVYVNKTGGVVIAGVAVALVACAWGCLRRNRIGLGAHVLVWTLWTVSVTSMFTSVSPATIWFFPMTFIAATLLGPAWAGTAALTGIALAVVAINGAELGLQMRPIFPYPPRAQLFNLGCALVLTFMPFYLVIRRMRSALQRAGAELARRTHAQQDLQHSEQRLTLALEAARTGIWEWDVNTGRITATPQAEAVFGLRAGEFDGTYEGFLRLVHPADAERVAAFNRGVLDGRAHGLTVEHRIIRPDGVERWIEGRGTQQYDANGKPARVIGTVVDITPRKLAEQALQESESRYRGMIEIMADGTILRDMTGKILLCNSAAERILGVTAEEIKHRGFPFDGIRSIREDGTPFPRDERPVAVTLRTGQPCTGVVLGIQHDDSQVVWISINTVALRRDDGGQPYAVLSMFTDITERKRALQLLDSERRLLKTLIDHLPDDVVTLDTGGRFTMVNAAWLAQHGFAAAADVVGRTSFDVFDPALAKQVHAENLRILGTGVGLYNQSRELTTPGRGRRVLISKIPMRDGAGNITGIIGMIRDVTELKNALDALERERNLLRSLIDNLPDAIYAKDRELRYVLINAAGMRLRGVARHDDILGKSARDFFTAEETAAIESEDRAIMAGGRALIDSERRAVERRTGERWISLSKIPLADGAGAVSGLLTINRDITVVRNMIEEVRRLNAELEGRVRARTRELQDANKELEAFSYSVSHDLRAPVRRIEGFGKFMLRDNSARLDAEGRARLERIVAAAIRAGELIEDLLMLARVSRQSMARRTVDMSALAAEAAAALAEANPQRQVEVVIAPELAVDADTGLMRVVLDNLVGNAWKFTAGRPAARIEVASAALDGERAYFVRDNGAGFDMQYAARLFTPFQRMHTAEQFEGTGIGLATVKRIVERHEGRIWIDSAVERGTTVYFTLGGAA
jgi:PAS domain S-box-containing protein